jgi:hypothetical protein
MGHARFATRLVSMAVRAPLGSTVFLVRPFRITAPALTPALQAHIWTSQADPVSHVIASVEVVVVALIPTSVSVFVMSMGLVTLLVLVIRLFFRSLG